jgi:hypothetical protein
MTPGIAELLGRLTDRKQVLLTDLEDAAWDIGGLLARAADKKPKAMREDIEYAAEAAMELIETIADLRRELETATTATPAPGGTLAP